MAYWCRDSFDSGVGWRVQWRVGVGIDSGGVGDDPRREGEGLVVSIPVMFKENVEDMAHEELVETFMMLQRMALHLEYMVEVQASTLKLAEHMLKELGVDLD